MINHLFCCCFRGIVLLLNTNDKKINTDDMIIIMIKISEAPLKIIPSIIELLIRITTTAILPNSRKNINPLKYSLRASVCILSISTHHIILVFCSI